MAGATFAQKNEFSVLAGGFTSMTSLTVSPQIDISTGGSVAVQISYGHRLRERTASQLYLDFPLTFVPRQPIRVTASAASVGKEMLLFTPGVRWKLNPASRVSPYLVGGLGPGWLRRFDLVLSPPFEAKLGWGLSLASSFGGGAEVRLSKRFRLRGEVRDFILLTNAGALGRRNHVVFAGGLGFTF
jgi:hypothetical protein